MRIMSRPPADTLMQRLVDEVGASIVAGRYPEGTVLPNETDLAVQHDVGRSSVREALKMLAAKGLIESRPRRGTTVRPRRSWNFFDSDVLRWLEGHAGDPVLLHELTAVRRAFEPLAAALAAEQASDAQLAGIEAAFTALEDAHDEGASAASADIELHAGIIEASGNRFLASLGALIATGHAVAARSNGGSSSDHRRSLDDHRNVVHALRARDAQGAQRAMASLLGREQTRVGHAGVGRVAAAR